MCLYSLSVISGWIRVILSKFLVRWCLPVGKIRRLHTTETTVNLTKPNNHPNSALFTSILDESEDRGPYYASFSRKRRNVTFLSSEIKHFCHRRPRSSSYRPTVSFATKPGFTSCPLIGRHPGGGHCCCSPRRLLYANTYYINRPTLFEQS